jgi:amidohydrolase
MDGDFSLEIERGGMPVVNDEDVVTTIQSAADDVLGPGHARVPARVEMGSEDFSVLSSMAPGAMFWLGAGIEGDERALHNPTFDINERCLPIGAALLAESARRLLASY